MDIYQPNRKARGRARERHASRRGNAMVTRSAAPNSIDDNNTPLIAETPVMSRAPRTITADNLEVWKGRALVFTRDAAWYARRSPWVWGSAIAAVLLLIALFFGHYITGARVYPNVWALETDLGGLTPDEASAALQSAWTRDVRIILRDGAREWSALPADLGMRLNAPVTIEAARAVGLGGMPFGYEVLPAVELDFLTAQNFLLDLTELSKILPYNAGYSWQGDQLVGMPGTDGRFLDIAATMETLQNNLPQIATTGVFNITMTTTPPDQRDPEPYLLQARAFTAQDFIIRGYDPFSDEHFAWTTDRNTLTSWLEAGESGLSLRDDLFADFIAAQTASLQSTNDRRYVEPIDTMSKMRAAITSAEHEITIRVRYFAGQYTVQSGDNGYRIARRTGVPFYQLQQANPGRDWEVPLSVGESINVPSPDITLPLDPVPNKRIVVDMRSQTLVAFENGEVAFNWSISTGIDRAPTSPGIYQILSHHETASGGSYELCSAVGCANWVMDYFMGIYEVVPGLVNGFHGNVLLPNGTLLGGGNVGSPFTYGCIMSEQEQARMLYYWADQGTIVEIIGRDYPPRSRLAADWYGQQAAAQMGIEIG